MTTIKNISIQITDSTFTVFTTYNNKTDYVGHTPFKTLQEALANVLELASYKGLNGFKSIVEGYELITFPTPNKPHYEFINLN